MIGVFGSNSSNEDAPEARPSQHRPRIHDLPRYRMDPRRSARQVPGRLRSENEGSYRLSLTAAR